MMAADRLYPYCLEPQEKAAIWGGDALVSRYGKIADPHVPIGESWECWDANAIRNGRFAGASLGDLRHDLHSDLMGTIDPDRIFPVLTKIIDARQPLSVQVHPDDAYAQRVEHEPNGKTECWYILAAAPGAELILGWVRDTDRDEYERRVADGTLAEILRRVPVHAGEAYYLPAGTLHAIGAGIELFEAQQASDLTYRIFDWNRVGSDGRARELHTAKAGDVLNYHANVDRAVITLMFDEGGLSRSLLIADRRFTLEHVRAVTANGSLLMHGNPVTLTALGTPLSVQIGVTPVHVPAYGTIVAPAAVERIDFATGAEFLMVSPEPRLDLVRAAALANGVDALEANRFFAQFN